MYEIKIRSEFSSAHNLRNYRGKCEKLHGHNWQVEAVFGYKELDKDGLAVDFKDVKALLNRILEDLDHNYLNETGVFKKLNPTSENIARFIFDSLKKKNRHIRAVSVWENGRSSATYREG